MNVDREIREFWFAYIPLYALWVVMFFLFVYCTIVYQWNSPFVVAVIVALGLLALIFAGFACLYSRLADAIGRVTDLLVALTTTPPPDVMAKFHHTEEQTHNCATECSVIGVEVLAGQHGLLDTRCDGRREYETCHNDGYSHMKC